MYYNGYDHRHYHDILKVCNSNRTHLYNNEDNHIVYEFNSINNNNVRVDKNYVRLVNAAGQWRLKSINNKLTKVTYIWNGEMLGNFPSWGLKRAWLKQGNEVLGNLKETLKNSGS